MFVYLSFSDQISSQVIYIWIIITTQIDMQEIDHPFYPKSTLQEADAVAWVLTDAKSDLVKYPFTFFPLEPTEVRLKVFYAALCYSDSLHAREAWGSAQYPCCPGHQIVGQISMVGEEVTNLKIGDIVGVTPIRFSDNTCRYCTNKDKTNNMCEQRIYTYGECFGGYATHVQIQQTWAFKIPSGLHHKLNIIPPIFCAGITTYAPLKRYCKPGGTCAMIGIGGLGHLGVQFAHKLGMKVTAFTTKVKQPALFYSLGASDVQHSTDKEELAKNEGKYDLVVSTLYIEDVVLHRLHQRLTKPGGVFVMVGSPNTRTPYILDNQYLVNNQITVAGSNVGSTSQVKDMLEFVMHYNVTPIVEDFEFQDFNKAFERLEKGNPRFRCVVNVTDWAKKNGFDK